MSIATPTIFNDKFDSYVNTLSMIHHTLPMGKRPRPSDLKQTLEEDEGNYFMGYKMVFISLKDWLPFPSLQLVCFLISRKETPKFGRVCVVHCLSKLLLWGLGLNVE